MSFLGNELSTYRDYYSTHLGSIIDTRTETNQKTDGGTRLDGLSTGKRSQPLPFHSNEYV